MHGGSAHFGTGSLQGGQGSTTGSRLETSIFTQGAIPAGLARAYG